jgi:RNA polymerase sigma-70 factor, ECF subfamily
MGLVEGASMTGPERWIHERLLVLRCQTGDALAFEELVLLYQPRLRYFVHAMVRDDCDVEDRLQEIWLDVYRGIARLANPAAFASWLYRIARNRAFGSLRKRRPPLASLNGIDVPSTDDEDTRFAAEDAEYLYAALDSLAPEHREVLLLRFIEEMSYDDIACVTGCPVGTVRSRLHYAKRALRGVLERMNCHD